MANQAEESGKRIGLILRWTGRLTGFFASGFFLLFLVGEGLPGIIQNGIDTELLPFLPLLGMAIEGWVIALFNEKTGGILQIIGGMGMAIFHLINGGLKDLDMALVFGLPFMLCGSLFLICRRKYGRSGAAGGKGRKKALRC